MEIKPGIAEMIREEERVSLIPIHLRRFVFIPAAYFVLILASKLFMFVFSQSICSLCVCQTNNKMAIALFGIRLFGGSIANTKSESTILIFLQKILRKIFCY